MANVVVKQNDRKPSVTAIAKDAAGNVVDLTGYTTPKFLMMDWNGVVKVNAAATIVTPAAGTLQYDWATGDTDTVGGYRAEFEVTAAGGQKLTIPNDSYIVVSVVKEIG